MKELIVYEFEGTTFRPVPGPDGHPWFITNEVCAILGIRKVNQALQKLDADERGTYRIGTPGGLQEHATISESGLYTLILRSSKPIAIKFQKWVTREILPSIRRHGFYVDERQADKIPKHILDTWRAVQGTEPSDLIYNADGSIIFERKGRPLYDP